MNKKLYIGVDMGTSNVKGVLVDENLSIKASIEKKVVYLEPKEGFKEIDPDFLFRLICDILNELAKCADNAENIQAVCFSGATGNTMLLDKANKPLTNIISWLDEREIKVDFTREEVYPITGWPVTNCFPLAHISWWKKNSPEIFKKAKRIVMNNDYIISRLTGKFVLDYSTASTFILFNQVKKCWHKPFLDKLDIKKEQLSSLVPSGAVIGNITDYKHNGINNRNIKLENYAQNAQKDIPNKNALVHIVSKTGLSSKTAIIAGAFDHPSAALACNITSPGDLLLSCGTSWVGFYPVMDRNKIIDNQMLVDPFMSPNGPWGGIFSLPKSGSIIDEWLEALFGKKDYKAFNLLAEKSPDNANGLSIDLFKHSSSDNIKQIIQTKRIEDICRALMESTAKMMHNKIETFAENGIKANNITMVGGPTKSKIWIKILCEIIGKTITIHKSGQYAGALGAAKYARYYSL
jgi:xylulokinase